MGKKILVKNLQKKEFVVEYEDEWKVSDLKEALAKPPHSVQGSPADMKLIYSGKILTDDKEIKGLEAKEKDFLVLMISKPKAAPAASSSASAPAPAAAAVPATPAAPVAAPAAAPGAPAQAPAQAQAAPAAAAEGAGGNDDGTGLLTGTALQTSIAEMVSMGFPRDQVLRAMRASFNNPHRAVDYLMNGNIPEGLEAPPGAGGQTPAAAARGPAAPETPASPSPANAAGAAPLAQTPAAPAPAAGGGGNLFEQAAAAAQNAPQAPAGGAGGAQGRGGMIDQIRHLAQTNPAALNQLLGPLIQQHPELAGMDPQTLLAHLQAGGGDDDDDDEMMGGLDDPNVVQVELTEEERNQVENICAMGYPRNAVLEAFLVTDRNPDAAVQYLMDSDFADEQGDGGAGGAGH